MISVCVPWYAGHTHLDNLLEDLDAQTYRDFEVVFWADGPDVALKERLAGGKKRYRYGEIADGPHLDGGHHARDVALKNACGEMIVWVNQDNSIDPTYLEKMVQPLKEGWDVSFCRIRHEKHGTIPKHFTIPPICADIDILNYMVRTDIARRVGFPWRHYEADHTFICKVLETGARWIFLSGEILGVHR